MSKEAKAALCKKYSLLKKVGDYMKFKRLISLFLACLFILALSSGCSSNRLEQISDRTERPLNTTITTVKEAIPFAVARAKEWQPDAFLSGIGVGFEGKDEIASKKGIINTRFLVYNKEKEAIGRAEVLISMKNNNIYYFSGGPPVPKLERGLEIHPDTWNIDINEALDLAITAIGKKELEKYQNPKIVILCVQSLWEVTLYSGTKNDKGMLYEHIIEVKINPQKGQIMSIRNIKQLLEDSKNRMKPIEQWKKIQNIE